MGSLPQTGFEDKLGAMLASCQKINSAHELGPLLDIITGEGAKLLECDRVNISLRDPQRNGEAEMGTADRTSNVLVLPMRNPAGDIIGVLKALNKRTGAFTAGDEESLR